MTRLEIWKYIKSYAKKRGVNKILISKRLYDKLLPLGAKNNLIPIRDESGQLDFINLHKYEDY